jgi:hypothetical protein
VRVRRAMSQRGDWLGRREGHGKESTAIRRI